MLTLLKSLVQPKLDYCSQLWSPSDHASINQLESVQRHLVDSIRDIKLLGLNYWETQGLFTGEEKRKISADIYLEDQPGDGLWL